MVLAVYQIPETSCEAMREELKKMEATIESESTSGAETTLVFAVEPGAFRRFVFEPPDITMTVRQF